MREVLVSQNEKFMQQIEDLTDERKSVNADREKLISECADLHAQIEEVRNRNAELLGFEGLNRRLDAERQALSSEVLTICILIA